MSNESNLPVAGPGSAMIKSWEEVLSRAEFFSRSGLVPSHLRGKPADIAIILQMGWELGIGPMQAINGITVIQGKPTVDPQLAVAMIHSKIPDAVIQYKELSEQKAVVVMARSRARMDEAYTAIWDLEKARKMELLGKENYRKQPGNMLKWRAVMEAARAVFPDIIKGIYGDDEMQSVVESAPQNDTKAGTLNQILGGKPEPKDVIAEVEDPKPQGMTDEEKAQFADTFGPAEGEDQAGPDPEEFVLGFGRNKGTKLRALSDEDIVALQKWIAETARKPLNETNKKHLEAVGAVIRKRNIA